MKYFFKPDWFVLLITLILLCCIYMLISITPWNSIWSIVFFGIMIAILAYSLAIIPLWVVIDDEKIRIQQLMGHKTFLKGKVKIQALNLTDIENSHRIFGSSGYGGYTGWFKNNKLGKFYMIILNKKELALVETEQGKKYVINYPQSLFK